MDDVNDIAARFCAAARARGFVADALPRPDAKPYVLMATALLSTDNIFLRCNLLNEGGKPYISLRDIHSKKMTDQGHGRPALMALFNIADCAGIYEVRVTAGQTGRYFHAAHFVQCRPVSMQFLQETLLKALSCYVKQAPNLFVAAARSEQAKTTKRLIQASDGQLGLLVQQLRMRPVIGETDEGYANLAKQLFLSGPNQAGYYAHWTRRERDMARAAYGPVPPAPVARLASIIAAARHG